MTVVRLDCPPPAGLLAMAWPPRIDASWRPEPTLLINPPDDVAFATAARNAVGAGARTPEDLQAVLRERYPDAVVRQRDIAGESFTVWYVYRDGRWAPRQTRSEPR